MPEHVEFVDPQLAQRVALVMSKRPSKIFSAESATIVADYIVIAAEVRRSLEQGKKRLLDPLRSQAKAITSAFDILLVPISEVEEKLRSDLADWRRREKARIDDENARLRAEQAKAERERQEKIEAAFFSTAQEAVDAGMSESDARELANIVADETEQALSAVPVTSQISQRSSVKGSIGTVTARKVWTVEVTSIADFATWVIQEQSRLELLAANMPAIRSRLLPCGDADAPVIPGLRFDRVEQIAARTKR